MIPPGRKESWNCELTYGADGDVSRTALPVAVRDWAGLDDIDPIIGGHEVEDKPAKLELSSLNDDYQFEFDDIANLIEEQF